MFLVSYVNAGTAKNATTHYDIYVYSVFLPIRKVAAVVTAKCQHCDGASLCGNSSGPNLPFSVTLNNPNSLFTYYAPSLKLSTLRVAVLATKTNISRAKERRLFLFYYNL